MSRTFTSAKMQRTALLIVMIFLISDLSSFSVGANSYDLDSDVEKSTHASPIMVEGLPPLMCGEELCERPLRTDLRTSQPASEENEWWLSYGPDLDWNGMDDRLQRVLAGQESISPTAILGEDGRKTVAIVVDYAWHPGQQEAEELESILRSHSWIGSENDAWFQTLDSVDSIVVDKVPVSALMDIYHLDGVVVVEMQNVMVPSNNIASKATRSFPSDVYTASAYERDYTGDGVVIAILDTGVDNEHRSLNDFDDIDDEPDAGNPTSYDDHKWVAGYDATSTASNPDGSQDPDDGQGHGTHVAGSALGTGDASRLHTGTAPGAYLVDIKVLTDAGGTNSQYSLNGIQWMINNANQDWGHNSSAQGIQIGSMSFGSVSSPLNPGDEGDNGTGTEARLVNNATLEQNIVCVIAMGNDGTKRVPSPASADYGLSVAAASDFGTVNRTDDGIASYSNSGPRLSDGDDDDWDELKPDIASFGSNIISATAATGTSIPGAPRPEADSDYDEKDGTSMATPIASGVVATVIEANPSLDALEIRDIIRNSSEFQQDKASETSVSNRWNNEWGFGLIDASCAIDMALDKPCTPLEGGVVAPPPSGNGSGDHVDISQPTNDSWWMEGSRVTISGTTDVPEGVVYDQIQVNIIQYLESGNSKELKPWTIAGGNLDSWFLDVTIKSDWIELDEDYVIVSVRAFDTDTEAESAVDFRVINLARMGITLASPTVGTSLQGNVDFSGTVEGVEHDYIEFKVDSGDWEFGMSLPELEVGNQDWTFSWDSRQVTDGSTRLSFRMVNESGLKTDDVRRTFTIDNQPAAPDFIFTGVVEIKDEVGLPMLSAVAGSALTVDFTIANVGDLDVNDVFVKLDAPGSDSEVYSSTKTVGSLKEGDSKEITLYWWATEVGTHEVSIIIDPSNVHSDLQRDDNTYSFNFEVTERPVEPTLRFMPGAVKTSPPIPAPDEPYELKVRVDNLGQTDATNLLLKLYMYKPESVGGGGYQPIDDVMILQIDGSQSSSGYEEVSFLINKSSSILGSTKFEARLVGDGVEVEHSQFRFNVVVDNINIGSPVRLDLISTEIILDFVGLDEGGLLFTTLDGELLVRTITDSLSAPGQVKLADSWAGELAVLKRDDGLVQAAWTENRLSQSGYFMTDISMTSITSSGETTSIQSHMTPLKLSEGNYWGLALTQNDERMVLGGYHRDIATGGSWQDSTSIFVMISDTPQVESSWSISNVLYNIDIKPSQGDSLGIALGEENLHILYQENRDDVSGIERVGLMYAHGKEWQSSWSFQYSVGDDASNAQLETIEENDRDILIASWIEGSGASSKIAYVVTDNAWSVDEPTYFDAQGADNLELSSDGEQVRVFFDEINVYGPVTRYGTVSDNGNGMEFAMSNMIAEGFMLGYAGLNQDGIIAFSSSSGVLSLRSVASLEAEEVPDSSKSLLDSLLDPLPGDRQTQQIILGVSAFVMVVLLVGLVVSVRSLRREKEAEFVVQSQVDDDGIDIMVDIEEDDTELAINLDSEELVVKSTVEIKLENELKEDKESTLAETLETKIESGQGNSRLDRRMKRKQQREIAEITEKMLANPPSLANLPPLDATLPPLDAELDLPPLPALPPIGSDGALPPLGNLPPIAGMPTPQREVSCSECSAKFTVKDMMLKKTICPICSTVVKL